MRSSRLLSVSVVLAAVGWGGVAAADLSKPVISAFRGDLVISKGELAEGKSDKDTIAKIKTDRLKELDGEDHASVQFWHFHYTAFLTKPGATTLKVEFYSPDKKLVADNRLEGVDPKNTVVSGEISITEDDGLTKGKLYTIKVVGEKDAVVAQTTLVMK